MLPTAFIAVSDVAIDRYVPLDSELLEIGDESICFFLRQNAPRLIIPLREGRAAFLPSLDAVASVVALLKDLIAPGIVGV